MCLSIKTNTLITYGGNFDLLLDLRVCMHAHVSKKEVNGYKVYLLFFFNCVGTAFRTSYIKNGTYAQLYYSLKKFFPPSAYVPSPCKSNLHCLAICIQICTRVSI